MPVNVYKCIDCKTEFEVITKIEQKTTCPVCDSTSLTALEVPFTDPRELYNPGRNFNCSGECNSGSCGSGACGV